MTIDSTDTQFATEWELLDPALDFRQMMDQAMHQMMSFESAELALIPPPRAMCIGPLAKSDEVHP